MEEKIDRILSKVSAIHTDLEVMKSEQKHICSKLDRHDKALYNNGFGIVFQTKVLWLLAGGCWAVLLIFISKSI